MVFRKKMIQPNIFTESLIFSDDWDAKGLVIDKEKNKCKKCNGMKVVQEKKFLILELMKVLRKTLNILIMAKLINF